MFKVIAEKFVLKKNATNAIINPNFINNSISCTDKKFKNKNVYIKGIINLMASPQKRFGNVPDCWDLIIEITIKLINKKFTAQMKLMGNYELSKKKLYENYKFKSYKEFIKYCNDKNWVIGVYY